MKNLLARPFLLILLLAAPLAAQNPVGREVPVNQTRAGRQMLPDVGVAADGSFVVVWEDEKEGRIWARRYQADGKPRGGELRVSRLGDHQQAAPAVAVRPDGSFVVVWNRIPGGGKPIAVYASQFSAAAQPFGQPRLVAFAGQASAEEPAAVVILPDGGFFVAWSLEDGGTYWSDGYLPSRDVYARRFTRDGALVGGRVTLNGDSFGDQSLPQCAVSRGEELVCTWTTGLGEGSFGDIAVRRFDLDGLPLGNELQVNEAATESTMQVDSSLAVDENGVVLVVWVDAAADFGVQAELTDMYGVMGRLLDASGRFLTPAFRLPTTTLGQQVSPGAAATDSGFVVVWAYGGEVLLRRLSAGGTFTSGERLVNQRRDGNQAQLALAFGPRGGAVAWASFQQGFHEADIAARRLR